VFPPIEGGRGINETAWAAPCGGPDGFRWEPSVSGFAEDPGGVSGPPHESENEFGGLGAGRPLRLRGTSEQSAFEGVRARTRTPNQRPLFVPCPNLRRQRKNAKPPGRPPKAAPFKPGQSLVPQGSADGEPWAGRLRAHMPLERADIPRFRNLRPEGRHDLFSLLGSPPGTPNSAEGFFAAAGPSQTMRMGRPAQGTRPDLRKFRIGGTDR